MSEPTKAGKTADLLDKLDVIANPDKLVSMRFSEYLAITTELAQAKAALEGMTRKFNTAVEWFVDTKEESAERIIKMEADYAAILKRCEELEEKNKIEHRTDGPQT